MMVALACWYLCTMVASSILEMNFQSFLVMTPAFLVGSWMSSFPGVPLEMCRLKQEGEEGLLYLIQPTQG